MRYYYELMKINEVICIKYLEQWLHTEKAVNCSVERNPRSSRQFSWSLA